MGSKEPSYLSEQAEKNRLSSGLQDSGLNALRESYSNRVSLLAHTIMTAFSDYRVALNTFLDH